MQKNIFVNATAATEGGILTVLMQFIDEIIIRNDCNKKYYIFTTNKLDINNKNIKIISEIKGKKKLDRIKWDIIGIKKWSKKNKIFPSLILSLQNTGINFKGVPQIVYVHQPLPYSKNSKWNIFKKDERSLWIYKNIYKWWIDFTVKNKCEVIVQTKWMRDALIERGYKPKEITISKPYINEIDTYSIGVKNLEYKYLFYPAADYKYKNHKVLIEAVKYIRNNNIKTNKFKIVLTLNEESNVYTQVVESNVEMYFDFIGKIEYKDVLAYYKSCHGVVFPSYIETFGLPIIESSMFGKKILVSDCEYAREVNNGYDSACFIKYNDVQAWGDRIVDILANYKEKPREKQNDNGWDNVFILIDEKIYKGD